MLVFLIDARDTIIVMLLTNAPLHHGRQAHWVEQSLATNATVDSSNEKTNADTFLFKSCFVDSCY